MRIAESGSRWWVDPSALPFFRERILPFSGRWEEMPRCRVLKHNIPRTVYVVDFDEGPFSRIFLKDFRVKGWRERLKYLLVPSKARNEWRKAMGLNRLGVETFRPIAWGECRISPFLQRAVLVTEDVPDSETLASYWRREYPKDGSWKERKEILHRLGVLARLLHKGGYYHRDFHAGNVLVSGPERRLILIDLHSIWKTRVVLPFHRKSNLGKLFFSLRPFLTRDEELTLLEAYFSTPPPLLGRFERFVRKVEAAEERILHRRSRSRTLRCLKNSSAFEVLRTGRYLLRSRRMCDSREILERVEEERKRLVQEGEGGPPKNQRDKIRILTLKAGGREEKACLKAFPRERFGGLLSRLCGSRGLRAWIAGNGFQVRGIATALPLAYVEERGVLGTKQGFLLSRYLEGTLGVNEFVERYKEKPLSRELAKEKRAFTRALARFLKEFHRYGVYQNDCSAKNILVEKGEDSFRFFLVDLDGVNFWRQLTRRRRIKNLSQLNDLPLFITRTDRLRFFREYRQGDRTFLSKKVILRIASLTQIRQEKRCKKLGKMF